MLPPSITEYLESHRDEHLESLFELLRIPSIANVHDHLDSCKHAAAWIAKRLDGLGFRAEVLPIPGGEPNVLAEYRAGDDAPTVLIYGHYDVQPPDPLELWQSPPFEPEVRDGRIYARGAGDDKGQVFAHIMAFEAWLRAEGSLPVNVKFLIEGEEEIGSPRLESWMAENAERLAADAAVISDSGFFAPALPSITYGLRGLVYFELTVRGPGVDLHSGQHGGAIINPANALAKMIGLMHDETGRVAIDGFYDDVLPLSDSERRAWAKLPFDEADYAASLGLGAGDLVGGEQGYGVLERRWARPTLDCNGIIGGYTAEGSKTVIPARASAKISMRLVPNQDPARVEVSFRRFVEDHTPAGLVAEVERYAAARPVLLETDSPAMQAGRDALAEAFGPQPAMIRGGGSIPIAELFQRLLGLDAVMMGFGLPDDAAHSPNEKFDLDQLWRGSVAAAAFLGLLREKLREKLKAK